MAQVLLLNNHASAILNYIELYVTFLYSTFKQDCPAHICMKINPAGSALQVRSINPFTGVVDFSRHGGYVFKKNHNTRIEWAMIYLSVPADRGKNVD